MLALAFVLAASRDREGSHGSGTDTASHFPVDGLRIAAAGDIACEPGEAAGDDECRQVATSDLLVGIAGVLALGDLQYNDGAYAKVLASYDRSWGHAKAYEDQLDWLTKELRIDGPAVPGLDTGPPAP